MARILVLADGFDEVISLETASSFSIERETRTMLKPARASWREYSLPIPSEAPVTIAQLPLGPNDRSCVYSWLALVSFQALPRAIYIRILTYRFPWQNKYAQERSRDIPKLGADI